MAPGVPEVVDGYCLSNNSVKGLNRELSHPVLLEGPGQTVDIAFTYHRKAIKHIRLNLGI